MFKRIDIRGPYSYVDKKMFNSYIEIVSNSFFDNIPSFESSYDEWNVEFTQVKSQRKMRVNKEKKRIYMKEWFDFDKYSSEPLEFERKKLILIALYNLSIQLDSLLLLNKKEEFKEAYKNTIEGNFQWKGYLLQQLISPNRLYRVNVIYNYENEKKLIDIHLEISSKKEQYHWKTLLISIKPMKSYLREIVEKILWPSAIHMIVMPSSNRNFHFLLDIKLREIAQLGTLPIWCILPSNVTSLPNNKANPDV